VNKTQKRIWNLARHIGIGVVVVAILWVFLPPLFDNAPFVRRAFELRLGRLLNANVEIGQVSIATWTGGPTFDISAITVSEPESGITLAYAGQCILHADFWPMLIGRLSARDTRISRIDVDLPADRIHAYLLQRAYLSKPLLSNAHPGIRESLTLRDVVANIRSRRGIYSVSAHGLYDTMRLHDAAFDASLVFDRYTRETRVAHFGLTGIHRVVRHTVTAAGAQTFRYETPIACALVATVRPDSIIVPQMVVSAGTVHVEAQFEFAPSNTAFHITLPRQSIGPIIWTASLPMTNMITDVECHVSGSTTTDDVLRSHARISARYGRLCGYVFSNMVATFQFDNDRINAMTAEGFVFGGAGRLTLQSTDAKGIGETLSGNVHVDGMALDDILNALGTAPIAGAGVLSADLRFQSDTARISDVVTRRLDRFDTINGVGTMSVSNAILQVFATEEWMRSPEVPKPLRRYLSLMANLSGAGQTIPLLARSLREITLKAPRTLTADVELTNGLFSTPSVRAMTPFGRFTATGNCDADGILNYTAAIHLTPTLVERYGTHPLLGMFRRGDDFVIPLRLHGTLMQPRAQLDLSEEQQAELEDRLMMEITAYLEKKMQRSQNGAATTPQDLQLIEKNVRALLRKLL